MIPDPNDEILATKRRLAAKFDNDIHRIVEDLRKRQSEGDYEVISLPPRRCSVTTNHAMQRSGGGDVSGDGESTPAAR
jgi:hypothetical protein